MTQKPVVYPRIFGKIILTLENCLLADDKLEETPSHHDGLDRQTEVDLRILGCELIQTAGILLKLPQVAMATGQVLFQRFFYSKSFVRHGMEVTAMSCVCLASKIEEAPRRIRDVINVFHHIKQVRAQRPIQPMILDAAYIAHKTQVIKAERRVLKELGFCVHVKHPHKLIVMYLQVLGYEKNQKLMQSAWNYMNDSLRTDAFVRFSPETIACACIYLTARKLNFPLPNSPPWFGLFKVTEDDIIDVSYRIAELYRRPKPNVETLELAVEELRKKYMESRLKGRAQSQGTPPAVTTVDRSNGSHNAWGGFISRTLPVTTTTTTSNPSGLTLANSSNSTNNNNTTGTADQATSKSAPSKRSATRSRSRSPNDDNRSRTRKKSRHRSRSPAPSSKYGGGGGTSSGTSKKKSSRNYSRSRSPSSSPYKHSRKRNDRKSSPGRAEKSSASDYYANGGAGDRDGRDRVSSKDDRDRHQRDSRTKERSSGSGRDRDRSKHDRYASRSSHRSTKHRERSRDRSADRSRDRKR